MKRNVHFLLIAALLCMLVLQACSGTTTEEPSTVQALIPPEMADQPSADSLAGAAGSSTATVPPLCSGAEDTDTAAFAAEVIRLVNVERAAAGLSALTAQDQLMQAAQKHSIDMGCNFFMSHTGSDGSTPYTRMNSFGYYYTAAGENVAAGYTTPAEVMDGWMASSGHRANILNANFTQIGIGYIYNPEDPEYYSYYWTMTLGTP